MMSQLLDLKSRQLDAELSAYDYDLPVELIAQKPVEPRDSSRLIVVHRKEGRWEHRSFKDLPDYLDSNDLIVANNSRVFKARLLGFRLLQEQGRWVRGGKVEFFLLEKLKDRTWEGLFHASARKYVSGLRFEIPSDSGKSIYGILIRGSDESPTGTVVAEFDQDPVESGVGEVPLPPYIERQAGVEDESSYQTIYAKELGSAAAPTAGLHFTDQVLGALKQRGVEWAEVTLHVGLGTFRPVKNSDINQHVMHEERYEISPSVAEKITNWKRESRRILAVGTTSVRTLESSWKNGEKNEEKDGEKEGEKNGEKGHLKSGPGKTSLFIRPGNVQFQVVDRLLTNFHLPRSTLLMLVSAFAGRELTLAVYQDAVRQKYRFFSYGDAMLILD